MVLRIDVHRCLFSAISRGGMHSCIAERYDIYIVALRFRCVSMHMLQLEN
jgi:hypothetical protein